MSTPLDPAPLVSPPTRRRGKRTIMGGAIAALLLGGSYSAYAVYNTLDGGGPQPHDVLPASTQMYVRVDLDPSASQKIELFKLIRKFPDLADEIGIKRDEQDARELIFGGILGSQCPGIDYDEDIEPWLGERAGVGASLKDDDPLIAVQVTDEKQSRAGIRKLFSCLDEPYGIAYLDGYAIVAPTQDAVDASIEATAKGSLGDSEKFAADFDALGNQGIASFWIDGSAAEDISELTGGASDGFGKLTTIDSQGSFAGVVRVSGPALELAALGGGGQTSVNPDPAGMGALPADTVAALSLAGVGEQIAGQFDGIIESFADGFNQGLAEARPDSGFGDPEFPAPDPYSFLESLEDETGFDLDEDLATLLGDRVTLAIGGDNLENLPTFSGPDDVTSLDIALALTSEPAKALDLIERLADLAAQVGIPLVATQTDDGAVLSTNRVYAQAITDANGNLRDNDTFAQVIADDPAIQSGVFINLGAILDKVAAADPPPDIADALDDLEPLSAFGLTQSSADGDRWKVSLRLAFN